MGHAQAPHHTLIASLAPLLLAGLVGCQTEVPYDTVAQANDESATPAEPDSTPDEDDAPAWSPEPDTASATLGEPANTSAAPADEPDEESQDWLDAVGSEQSPDEEPRPDTAVADAEDSLPWDTPTTAEATPPAPAAEAAASESPPEGLLPWQAASSAAGPSSSEAQKLFGAVAPQASDAAAPGPATPAAEATAAVADPAETSAEGDDQGGFGSFLEDAYDGLIDESQIEKKAPPRPKPSRSPVAGLERFGAPPAASNGGTDILANLPTPRRKPKPKPKPEPKAPSEVAAALPWDTTDAPETPTVVEPLVEPAARPGPSAIAEAPSPRPSSSSPSTPAEPMPWDVASSDASPAADPLPPPAPRPTASATRSRDFSEELPAPSSRTSPTRVASRAPTIRPRAPDFDPLPAVPVARDNTRHIAWLLGGKIGLARLADTSGATRREISGWATETDRLAERLRIAAPRSSVGGPVEDRVLGLLNDCAALGETVADAYGSDHAALVEIALKTNALLMLHDERPDLAGPVARAVAAAADRAGLPPYLWRETVDRLEADPDADAVRRSVMELHASVEAYLR